MKKDQTETEDKKVLSQEFQSYLFTDQKIEIAQKNISILAIEKHR